MVSHTLYNIFVMNHYQCCAQHIHNLCDNADAEISLAVLDVGKRAVTDVALLCKLGLCDAAKCAERYDASAETLLCWQGFEVFNA